jgi:transmembrane sensor
MIEFSHISKLLIKKKLKILTNTEKVQLKKFNKKYPFSKEIKIAELIDSVNSYSKINKENAWKLIEARTKTERPVIKLFKKRWYGYAASLVLILTSAYFLKDNLFNNENNNPINYNVTIQSGTDKATLTLEDGEIITLAKGTKYQTKNAESNGEKIVYQEKTLRKDKVAYNYLTVPRGGQFQITLSDGTKVWLNSESQLKYPISFIKGESRRVELVYGEAYFDVSPSTEHKGSKFKVFNKFQEIEVLGTEFNIQAYRDETNIYTTLVEGRVLVSLEGIKQDLRPNQQSKLNTIDNTIKVENVDVYNEISWKDGVFSFDRKPLKEIMKIFARWYDLEIILNNKSIENNRFYGALDKDQPIEDILEILKKHKIISSYKISGKKIVIK